ncbi:MAG: DHA2 family efflux MFS transporter permease subunit [Acetobacteraceae bacterium]
MKRVLAALGPPLLVFRGPDGRSLPLPGAPPLTGRLMFGLFGALIAGVMSLLNTRLTNFGVADLRGGVGLDVNLGNWATTAFSVGSISIVPATPWLTNIFSPRRMFVVSILLTTVSTVALGTVPTYPFILLLRFLQGVGAGALLPLLLASVLRFTPLQQRVWGIAMYAGITTLSPSVAESIAGWFTEYLSWKVIFWQNFVVAPIAIIPIMIGLPVEPLRLAIFRDTDYPAIIFSILGVAALTAALSEGQTLNWFDSGVINGLFAIAAVSLVAFVINELTCDRPLIDVRLFQQVNFSLGLIVLLTFNFTLLGAYYVLPQFAAVVKGWRELQIGEILIWLALPQIVLTPLSALLLRYVDARLLLACGLFTFSVGAYMATYITSDWYIADFLPSQLVQACAFPFIMPPLVLIATSLITPANAASGSALFNIVRTFAGTLGTAVAGALLTVRERVHSAMILLHVQPGDIPNSALGSVSARASVQAYVMACADAYGMLGLISIACMVLVLWLRETPVARPVRWTPIEGSEGRG